MPVHNINDLLQKNMIKLIKVDSQLVSLFHRVQG